MRRLVPCLLLAGLLAILATDSLWAPAAHAQGKKGKAKPRLPIAPVGKPKPPQQVPPNKKGKDKNKPPQPVPPNQKGKFATGTALGFGTRLYSTYPQGAMVRVNVAVSFKDAKGLPRSMTPGMNAELLVERQIGSQKYEVLARAKTNARGSVTFDWKIGKNFPRGEHLVKARFPAQGKFLGSESVVFRVVVKKP
jgi:hypothetical protein